MKNILLAVFSGLLVMFSFPTILFGWHVPNLSILAWVALVPLFLAIARSNPAKVYLLSFVSSLVCFAGSLYWIYTALHVYGKINPPVSVAITLLLAVVLAAYISLAPFIAKWINLRWRAEMLVLMPVAWVAVEYARGHVPWGGFPWSDIAMSQWSYLVPIQIVDLVGVYGLIFVLIWVNWFIAELIMKLVGYNIRWVVAKIVVTSLIIVAVFGYGMYRLHTLNGNLDVGEMVSVGIVQGNISQGDKWDARLARRNLNVYRKMTGQLFESGADLIVWPEASFPNTISEETKSADPRVFGLPEETIGDLPSVLLGAVVDGQDDIAYNSALLFNAKGSLIGRYDKVHLVPFGEYIPLRDVLFFAKKITSPIGDFKPGTDLTPIKFSGGKIGLLLCFEDAFPYISRTFVRRGADLLVNITNDAWYDISSAPYQHLAFSVFRAVENRRYLIRSANTGVSALIAPSGEVLMQSPIFERSILAGGVWPVKSITFYTKYGDWFAWACVAYTVFGMIMAFVMAIRARWKSGAA